MKKAVAEVMIGNHAMARGLVEAGLELAAAYPGTPSSEILPGVIDWNRKLKGNIHAEWSVNEKCAFEVACGGALSGRKAACMMKQVGLNVAFASLMKTREHGIKGGLVIVACDDPGPQSSQTEQDTRLLAVLFGFPVFDPSTPEEAADMAYLAMQYSFDKKIPVIVRSTHRVSHARQAVTLSPPGKRKVVLPEGLVRATQNDAKEGGFGIISSGMSCSIALDVISELGLDQVVPVYKVVRIFPFDEKVKDFAAGMEKVLVLEETDVVIEALVANSGMVLGRRNGYVPDAGELTYDIVRRAIKRVAAETGISVNLPDSDPDIEAALETVVFPSRPPRLCAGCPHRASFYAMRYAYPDAIFPGDIGCYTLGISQGAVDTCLDMGAGVNFASGFYDTFRQDGELIPILSSVGDSTFFHSCLSALYDAVQKRKRFVLVIMDNGTTAMTGMQPTPQSGTMADGTPARSLPIEDVVTGFGIDFLRIIDPYDIPLMIRTVKEAYEYLADEDALPAVIIARRECLLYAKKTAGAMQKVALGKNCTGCKGCLTLYDCPGFVYNEHTGKVEIDEGICVHCGTCLYVCSQSRLGKGLFAFSDTYFLKNSVI